VGNKKYGKSHHNPNHRKSKNKPSFIWTQLAIILCTILGVLIVLSFIGVQPLATYKNNIANKLSSFLSSNSVGNPSPITFPIPSSVATATRFQASNSCYPPLQTCLYVNVQPNNVAIANKTYVVDLYEKGHLRESTTILWNQPEINILQEKQVVFHIDNDEYNAYAFKDISNIFSISVHE
jgi:hypothetical protein